MKSPQCIGLIISTAVLNVMQYVLPFWQNTNFIDPGGNMYYSLSMVHTLIPSIVDYASEASKTSSFPGIYLQLMIMIGSLGVFMPTICVLEAFLFSKETSIATRLLYVLQAITILGGMALFILGSAPLAIDLDRFYRSSSYTLIGYSILLSLAVCAMWSLWKSMQRNIFAGHR